MEFNLLIEQRRSVRKFKKQDILDSAILECITASYNAPSWKNSQTARYHLISSKEMINRILNTLPDFNKESSLNAKLVVTTFIKNRSGFERETNLPSNELENGWGIYDLGLNNSYFLLTLKEKGLDSLVMGLRDSKAIRDILNIDENEVIVSVIAIGYKDEEIVKPKKKDSSLVCKIY